MKNQGTKPIETKRLFLRRYRAEDAEEIFHNWASDPTVTEFLTWPTHTDSTVTRTVLTDWLSRYADTGYYNWGIVLKSSGELIGNIAVVDLDEKTESAEIGYCIGKNWWGQQIMPEALLAVMDYLFEEVNVNRVTAHHDSNNPKSGRVMQKAGMKREGVLRAAGICNQGIYDKVCYSLLRQERSAALKTEEKQPSAEAVPGLQLTALPYPFTVCKVDTYDGVDLTREFVFTGKTDEELSLVCITEQTPASTLEREDGWRAFRIQGVLDFSLIGILAKIAAILAENQIGIFVVSTFNTDYVFIKEENFARALDVLKKRGYQIL